MNKIVIFGAGNIGRSFIGCIFALNKWEVTFIDANSNLVDLINKTGEYTVRIKKNTGPDELVCVKGVTAINTADKVAILKKLMICNICSTSVGKNALPFVIPVIAEAIKNRSQYGLPPMDILIAENIRGGKAYFQKIFRSTGLTGNEAGLVETSIGKMVPIMETKNLHDDPLVLYAEKYNSLIVDKEGFLNRIPDFPEIKAVHTIAAWVDRKLFIHNLGHAATAYFGFKTYPEKNFIAEVLLDKKILGKVRNTMKESAKALCMEYPDDLSYGELEEHIEDLLFRFCNRNLGDTVFRVGRDLKRKLNRYDRVVGAISLCLKHNAPCGNILEVFGAALNFRAEASSGIFPNDLEFIAQLEKNGLEWVIHHELGVDLDDEVLSDRLLGVQEAGMYKTKSLSSFS